MKNVKRQNQPTLRQRQAEVTRNLIVEAAQSLFLERGYTGTTIKAVAEQAGVAVSTVYAVFGSKRGILRAIRNAWHERTQIRQVAYGDPQDTHPLQRLEQLVQATRNQWQSGVDVIAIYTGAAAADPKAAAELNEALEGRRKGLTNFANKLEPHLHPGLDTAHAAAILHALCLPEIYDDLVNHSGWSDDEYQDWLLRTLAHELLGL